MQTAAATTTNISTSNANQITQITDNITITQSDDTTDTTQLQNNLEDRHGSLSQIQAADIELELNELPSLDQQDLPQSDVLTASLNEVLQEQDVAMNQAGHE